MSNLSEMKRLKQAGNIILEVSDKGLYAIERMEYDRETILLLTLIEKKAAAYFEELAELEVKLAEARDQGYTSIILVESNGIATHYDDMRELVTVYESLEEAKDHSSMHSRIFRCEVAA